MMEKKKSCQVLISYRGRFPYSQNPSVFKYVLFPNFKAWFWDRNGRSTGLLILTLTLVHLALKYPDNSWLGSHQASFQVARAVFLVVVSSLLDSPSPSRPALPKLY